MSHFVEYDRMRYTYSYIYFSPPLPPTSETLPMRSISHVAACRVELALCHRAPGVGFQEH